MKNKAVLVLLLGSFFLPQKVPCQQLWSPESFTVLDRPADKMMAEYLTAIVDCQFAVRDSLLATLKTAKDWQQRAKIIRDSVRAWTGPLPPRTPLNARVTGRIEREDYAIEKILFQSRPSFRVSANLYLPKYYPAPRPAILNVIGHSSAGKASENVQRRSIAQAKKGFVALTIDGIGQGERRIRDYSSFGSLPGAVHRVVGAQAFLSGTHLFNFMVWDAIRAVDYLCSRAEVDSARIGCTGTSGGGMMTTYILPFEPRITVAVPVCNPNTWSHRVHASLATDHEQVFFGSFEAGIDPRGDPLFTHVPKPLLINATTDDNLNPVRGVWALATWLFKAYSAHGVPEKIQTSMVKAGHGYNKEQREITYAWMIKWLGGDPADYLEGDFPVESEQDLWCTPDGDVYQLSGSLTPHELVEAYLDKHKAGFRAKKSRAELRSYRETLAKEIRHVLRIRQEFGVPAAERKAVRRITGAQLTPVILRPEKGILLPGVWLESNTSSSESPVILFLHEQGKSALAGEEQVVKALLGEGFRIFAFDLRGTGETAPGMEGYFWDFLAGRPVSGQRVMDVLSVMKWLSSQGVPPEKISIWAEGLSAVWAVLASALTEKVSGIILENILISFENVVSTRLPQYNHEILLPGVLTRFDIPHVYQALCPLNITLINPLLGDKSPAGQADIAETFTHVAATYKALGAAGNWSVSREIGGQNRVEFIVSTLIKMTGK